MKKHDLVALVRHPTIWGLGLLAGGLFLRSRRTRLSLRVKQTTLETQAHLLLEKNLSADNVVKVNALPSIPLTMCVPFRNLSSETESGDVSFPQVGGKGLSLLQMARVSDIHVPMGFVLPVSFFDAWTTTVRESDEFKHFLAALSSSSSSAVKEACQKLKQLCSRQNLTNEMREAITAGLKHVNAEGSLVAVRSSSPEEDLVASSFAGGYETMLGVPANLASLETAIAQVFASCYDERVFIYKMAQGFRSAARDPKIAVVIQLQVHARAAGVCFSLNPLDNDQDVALVNSCFGLGESVVSGLTSPDEFEVRHDQMLQGKELSIVRKVLGKKELVVSLGDKGGTVHTTESKNEFSISDDQVKQIVREVMKIVRVYGKPMDTEWAVDDQGRLVWLQARPITAHFVVPKNLASEPGQQKWLYLDCLTTVQGISGGLSILGCDFVGHVLNAVARALTGLSAFKSTGPQDAIMVFSGRSLHICLSNGLALAGKDQLVTGVNQMDMLTSHTLSECDLSEYVPKRKPNFGLPWLPLIVIWRQPLFLLRMLRAWLSPEAAYSHYQRGFHSCCTQLEEIRLKWEDESKLARRLQPSESPMAHVENLVGVLIRCMFESVLPAMWCGRICLKLLNDTVNRYQPGETEKKYLSALTHGLPGNVTLELSFRCEELANCLEEEGLWTKDKLGGDSLTQARELLQIIKQQPRALFLWRKLLAQYGHRAAEREIDIATPKYHENELSLLVNVLRMFDLSKELRPNALEKRLTVERREAAAALHEWLARVASHRVARRFDGLFKGYERLGGLRESHKYLLIKVLYLSRQRFLQEGRWHHESGRLDSAEEIFDLTLGDIEGAWHIYQSSPEPSLDLRALRNARRVDSRKAGDPKLFDSRGRELRAKPPTAGEGVYVGFPVSAGPGPVVGRTKTLHSPDEKPLLEGEVLVARATDPGWTPLFVPAAAVVLEVGGPLQHGALVAREYGKPCVVGIAGVVDIFADGTLVRVDGMRGTVELVNDDK